RSAALCAALLRWLPRRLRGVLWAVRRHARLSQRPPARSIQRPQALARLPVPRPQFSV
ncbi:hypothetical protein M885DRAFT_544970, partial [Pelagophyceae sp. CCMP2097]